MCAVRSRPNLADSFILLLQRREGAQAKDSHIDVCTKQLLTDEDISTAFGFRRCETRVDVENLLDVYKHLVLGKRIGGFLQTCIDHGTLERKIEDMIRADQGIRPACHEWFLSSNGLFQAGESRLPAHVDHGFSRAWGILISESDGAGEYLGRGFSESEREVLRLYTLLSRDFDNVPDRNHSAWIDFGFCLCQDDEWKIRMRTAYFELAASASLEEIAAFWKSQNQLDGLFNQKGIDIGDFKRGGIIFGRPESMDLGVYRLILEIDHVHRGTICACGHTFHPCHMKFPEPCLSLETVGDYGFNGLNQWEHWQMMLLYQELFNSPIFEAREMLAARRSADHEALTKYIEKMVDVSKYQNIYKAGTLFPQVRSRINWDKSQIPLCYCISQCGVLRQH